MEDISDFIQYLLMRTTQLFLTLFLVSAVLGTHCSGKPGPYYVNQLPIWEQEPKFIAQSRFGTLFEIGVGQTSMKMIHVFGDMYQMGFAQGELMKDQLNIFMPELWGYLESQVLDVLPKKLPKFLKNGVSNFAVGAALDLTYDITRPYTNSKYYQEMRGISDASGVPFKYFKRMHMIGELTKGACSMFGAWGKATPEGNTVQLRALDWDVDGPFRKYPLITVYHPSSAKMGNAWLNIGFVGWIGVLSGVNEHQLAVSEIGVSYPDDTFGKESRVGNPFTFVLRDVLQWDKTLKDSISRMQKTKRTCNLILGVGDGKHGQEFRGFQYSHSVLNVVNDSYLLPHNSTWHKQLQNVVYYGMDWLCPSYHERLHEMLEKYHGSITAQTTIRKIVPGLNSGNLQAVVYDLSNKFVYFSFGTKNAEGHTINAYERPYIGLNLEKMFAYALG